MARRFFVVGGQNDGSTEPGRRSRGGGKRLLWPWLLLLLLFVVPAVCSRVAPAPACASDLSPTEVSARSVNLGLLGQKSGRKAGPTRVAVKRNEGRSLLQIAIKVGAVQDNGSAEPGQRSRGGGKRSLWPWLLLLLLFVVPAVCSWVAPAVGLDVKARPEKMRSRIR